LKPAPYNKLRGSDEQLRLAQEASGLGVWDWDTRMDRAVWSDQHFSDLWL
jgi:PAS domain-containing protein